MSEILENMMRQNTLAALKESISGSGRLKKIILGNVETKEMPEIRLNLVYLTYDFSSSRVLLQYYAVDDDYPDVEISFSELGALIDR